LEEQSVSLKTVKRPEGADRDGVSLRPSDSIRDDAPDPIAATDDPADALGWMRRFMPPALDSELQPLSVALPGYLKQGVAAVGADTGCRILAYTAIGALHRGADWLYEQTEIGALEHARREVQRAGWSTSPLEWTYTLRGSGQRDHIELRRVGRFHANRVHRLKDALGLSLRVTGGLCALFGIVDLNLRGAVGRQASEQASDFLAELESRVVLAKDLARRAVREPATVTGTPRDQLRRMRHQ
jgi:hypothetical protein